MKKVNSVVPIRFIKDMAKEAGDILLRYFNNVSLLKVEQKAHRDYVTIADHASERYIISKIRAKYPHHAILAEESGGTQKRSGPCWIIDPLDGTTNYIHGVPIFGVSIAFFDSGRGQAGVVYDPTRKEMFWALRGHGAFLNRKRIYVSTCERLENALLATGFPFREQKTVEPFIKTFRNLCLRTRGIRRGGSAALDLVYTACGRFDGFWEFGLNAWDIAAGVVILKEAGARVSDLDGSQRYLLTGNIACASPVLYREMIKHIKQ